MLTSLNINWNNQGTSKMTRTYHIQLLSQWIFHLENYRAFQSTPKLITKDLKCAKYNQF